MFVFVSANVVTCSAGDILIFVFAFMDRCIYIVFVFVFLDAEDKNTRMLLRVLLVIHWPATSVAYISPKRHLSPINSKQLRGSRKY